MVKLDKPKPRIFIRTLFAAAAVGAVTAVCLLSRPEHEPVRQLTAEEQSRLKSNPARNPPPKNWEDSFIREKVPGESRSIETNQWVEAAKPHETNEEKLKEKLFHIDTAKHYYEWFLTESDPIERFNKLSTVKSYADRDDDVLTMLGMTKERFDGLVKSVQAQAGPVIFDKVQKMDKYDRYKIGYVIDLREIGNSLTNNNRFQYYQSLGTSREELQGHLCDGSVAEARGFLSRALHVKAYKMTERIYTYEYKSYLGALAQNIPDVYKMACEHAGRDVYAEVKITDAQIKALLEFKPEIIPEPEPKP